MSKIEKTFRVATSGKTVDGRIIDDQDLIDIANQYNPNTYTANIWIEHYRSMSPKGDFPCLGQVSALSYKYNKKNKVELFATLSVNDLFIDINSKGQKLFSSIEFKKDFADTGKPYLTGLAVTDSPASLGTEILKFSIAQDKHTENNKNQYSENQEFKEFKNDEQSKLEEVFSNLLSLLEKNDLRKDNDEEKNMSNNETEKNSAQKVDNSEQNKEKNKSKDFEKEMLQNFSNTATKVDQLSEKISNLETKLSKLIEDLENPENSYSSRPPNLGNSNNSSNLEC